jgi:hypothetical protein
MRREAIDMKRIFLLIFCALFFARTASAAQAGTAAPQASLHSSIRFEDASDKAGIRFTHSFGSRQLGSLLEGTGAGCVWFDYDNSGRQSLYVVNGRPLDDSMHPFPLKDKPNPLPHNHLYRNDGNGHFTDVTEKSGLDPDMYSVAVTAGDYDNDGFEDLLVTGYGKVVLYHNDGNGRHQGEWMGDQFYLARLRQGRMSGSVCGPLRQIRPHLSRFLRRG